MEEKSNPSQKKDEMSTEKQTENSTQKITNFFPILRTEGRAKMCGVKSDDSKQKEMLKKMKGKESMTLRSKRQDKLNEKASSNEAPSSSQTKEKIRNISVAAALKTPLSQVLRKNMEASDGKKETVGKSNSAKSSDNSGKATDITKRNLSDNEGGRVLRQKTPLPHKPPRAYKRRTVLQQTAGTDKPKPSSGNSSDGIRGRTTQKIATSAIDSLIEGAKSDNTANSNSGAKQRKYRKRHFRGSTYGLYLTPAKKKKKKLKSSPDESKDEDGSVTSTENNSFLDSEDANSLVSEDFFTPSEKSLVDEEHTHETQSSLKQSSDLIDEKKPETPTPNIPVESDVQNTAEQTSKTLESEEKIEITADYEENTQNAADLFQELEEMQWEPVQKASDEADATNNSQTIKAPQYDDISSESFSNALHFSFKKNSPKDTEDNEVKDDLTLSEKCEEPTEVDSSNIDDAASKETEKIVLPETPETCLSLHDNISEMFDMKDDSNIASSEISEGKEDLNLLTSGIKEDLNLVSTDDMLVNKENLNLVLSDVPQNKEDSNLLPSDTAENKDLNIDSVNLPEDKDFSIETLDTFEESKTDSNLIQSDIAENKDDSGFPSCDTPESKESKRSPYSLVLTDENKQDSNSVPFTNENKQNSDSLPFADENKQNSDSFIFPIENKQDSNSSLFTNEKKQNSDSFIFPIESKDSEVMHATVGDEVMNTVGDEAMNIVVETKDQDDSFKSHMEVDSPDKQDDDDGQSTIANCVKSRQRIKRRFTDDIVDTDLGILSMAAMASVKKALAKQESKDVIENFSSVTTHNEARKGSSMAKIECVFNYKQTPIKSCTCEADSYEANLSKNEEAAFCQAVDCIDDKLLGCSNPVVTSRLVRASVKIPFNIMCETHLWRLKHHHSCPYCGLFCSQGTFIRCSADKCPHFYHEQCHSREDGQSLFCLHCGSKALQRVHLEMHMTTPPNFFLSQSSNVSVPDVSKARISFSESPDFCRKDEDEPLQMYKIEDSGKILSSAGLPEGSYKEELEKLISALSDDKVRSLIVASDEFFDMAAAGNVLKVLYMLAKGLDPNYKFTNHEGDTSLHAAAAGGHLTVVHLLIQAGAVNDTLNEKMYTPLMLAAENGHKEVVHYLVKNGALTDFKGENGMSSLHLAAKSGKLEILKILMTSRDSHIDSQDDGGWTPIVWASEHDHLNVVRYLLKRGANPNIRDNEGNIGLHWSAFSGSVEISYLYLDYGCDINAVNELGDTPLHIAARQDSYPCVTLFLSRGADVTIMNKANKLPAECCIDKNSDTYLSLSLNMLLKKITGKYQHKAEKIIHRDISRGKEQLPIQAVNAVDDEMTPLDFLYVTENCETMPIKIDRTITSLQACHCEDDCSTASCSCASISYQCWYDKEGLLLPEFNLLDPPMLFECNRACSCWSLNCHNRVLQSGITCRLQLIRTKGKGWGVRTLKDIPKGAFICEYVGELISDSAADKRSDDSYLFDLDNRDGETYCLDARYYGNISRFINHLCEPNLVPVKVYVDHQDLNFPRIAFFSSRDIKQYEELGFDYGEKFWAIKYKFFTCECGSPKCKYSKESIHVTLANYYRRLKEEQMEEAAATQQPVAVVE